MRYTFAIFFAILFLDSSDAFTQEQFSLQAKVGRIRNEELVNRNVDAKKMTGDTTFSYFYKILNLDQNINDSALADSLVTLGASLLDEHNLTQSKKALYAAAHVCRKSVTLSPRLLASLYNNLAAINTLQGHGDSAIYFYGLALREIEQRNVKDRHLLMTIYANIGTALSLLQQSDQSSRARYYINRSLLLALELKDTSTQAQNYVNIGLMYDNSDNIPDSARYYYQQALQLSKRRNRKEETVNIFYYIGSSWGKQGNLHMAKIYFDSAIQYDKFYASNNNALQSAFGEYYLYCKNYSKAIPFFLNSLENNSQEGVTGDRLEDYYHLSLSYHALGENGLAYNYQKKYNDLRDSMLNEEKIHSVNQMEVKYRTAEKDNDLMQKRLLIVRQQSALRLQYLLLSGSLLIILLLAGYMRNKKNKAALFALQAKLMGEEEERKRMAQELHDGIVSELSAVKMNFNALAPIENAAEAEHFGNILSQLEESISNLRNTAHNLQPAILAKDGLFVALDNLCAKITAAKKLEIELEFFGELPELGPEVQLNIYRIVQELIQNMLKHSCATHSLIQVTAQSNKLSIIIDNNGNPIAEEENKGKNSIGLFNLQDRISFLKGTMEIESSSVYLEFPYKKRTSL